MPTRRGGSQPGVQEHSSSWLLTLHGGGHGEAGDERQSDGGAGHGGGCWGRRRGPLEGVGRR